MGLSNPLAYAISRCADQTMAETLVGLLTFGDTKKGLEFVIGDVLRPILMELALDGPVVAIPRPCNQINTDLWSLQTQFISHLLWNICVMPDLAKLGHKDRVGQQMQPSLNPSKTRPFTTF